MAAKTLYTYQYQIGEITFQVKSDLRLSDFLADKFQHFRLTKARPDVTCRIRGITARESCPATGTLPIIHELIHWLRPETLLRPSPLLYAEEVQSALRDGLANPDEVVVEHRLDSITVTNIARRRIDIFFRHDSPDFVHDTRYLDSGMIMPFLPAFDAHLLHSSGMVCRSGTGGLFLALDSGGKTTITDLLPPDGTPISDDLNLVRKLNGQFYTFSSPWCRVLGSTDGHPLGGLFFLEKAAAFDLIPLNPLAAMERIAHDPQNAFGTLPQAYRMRAISLRLDTLRHVPAYRLRFARDYVDWDAVQAAMRIPIHTSAAS